LAAMGCDEMQGFLYSKPCTASEFASLLCAPTLIECVND